MIYHDTSTVNGIKHIYIYLVGGFNTSEQFEFINGIGIIPYIMENKKCLKPPTSVCTHKVLMFYHGLPHHFSMFYPIIFVLLHTCTIFYHLFGAEGLASLKIKRMKPPSCKTEDMLLYSCNILQCN